MEVQFLLDKLKKYNIFSSDEYNKQAFSRNIGLFTPQEQEKLARARIAIPGMGGVGGVHLMTMVRTGIGRFHLSDFDVYEPANVNRQFGARVPDFGRSKMDVMKEQALSVNPFLEIKAFPDGINQNNVDAFLDGVDVVLDSLDFFAFDARRLLFNRAREKGVHVITAGPLGFSSAMLIFAPDRGMGFDEYFNIVDGMKSEDQYLAFALGLAPRATQFKYMDTSKVSFKSGKGPSLNLACQLCSAMAGTEAVRILLKKKGLKPVPYYFQFDPFVQKYYKRKLIGGNKNLLQQIKFKVVRKMLSKNEPVIPPYVAEKPSDPVMDEIAGKSLLTQPARDYLVGAGILAPSADNCQPWLFSWKKGTLRIESDPQRTQFFYDINQESTLITFGAVVENICIAASEIGLEAMPDKVCLSDSKEVSVQIQFREKECEPDTLAPFLSHRCINRKPYAKDPINPDLIKKLDRIFDPFSGVCMKWIENENEKKTFQEIVYLSDRVLFEEKRLHQGLFKFIHMGDEPFPPDGMNLGVLELSWFQKKIFPLFSQWKYQERMNKFMVSRGMAFNSIQLLRQTPLYGVLTLDERSPQGYVEAGRKMEQFWIMANSLGLAVAPMAGFVFLINHYYHNQARSFSPVHQRMILRLTKQFESVSGKSVGKCAPVMFFRLGYAPPQKNRTGRRNISDIIKS